MNEETQEWLRQTQMQLTNSKLALNRQQGLLIDELNAYVTNEMIRLSAAPSLKAYNDGIKALRKEIDRRFQEIIKEQTQAIASLLGGAFAMVFISHLYLLSKISVPTTFDMAKTYQGYILGRFYVKALHNVHKGFEKRYTRDSEALRRAWLNGDVDVADITKRRSKAAKESTDHFLFIDDQELHRVFEAAKYESAVYLREVHGIDTEKYWETKQDDRVRDTIKASHVAMQSVTIPGHELFDLVPFGKAYAPANSGIADQDINCRCMAIYNVI